MLRRQNPKPKLNWADRARARCLGLHAGRPGRALRRPGRNRGTRARTARSPPSASMLTRQRAHIDAQWAYLGTPGPWGRASARWCPPPGRRMSAALRRRSAAAHQLRVPGLTCSLVPLTARTMWTPGTPKPVRPAFTAVKSGWVVWDLSGMPWLPVTRWPAMTGGSYETGRNAGLRGVGLSRRPRQLERSSPDAHEPGRWCIAVADLGGAARACRRACRRSGSGGPGDGLAEQDADRRGYGYQRATRPAQIIRIDRRPITRSVAKLARTRRSPLPAIAAHHTLHGRDDEQ
jgi:hypothetical protein